MLRTDVSEVELTSVVVVDEDNEGDDKDKGTGGAKGAWLDIYSSRCCCC